jgi:hypothetical protein
MPVDFVLKFGFERVFNPFMSAGNPHATRPHPQNAPQALLNDTATTGLPIPFVIVSLFFFWIFRMFSFSSFFPFLNIQCICSFLPCFSYLSLGSIFF